MPDGSSQTRNLRGYGFAARHHEESRKSLENAILSYTLERPPRMNIYSFPCDMSPHDGIVPIPHPLRAHKAGGIGGGMAHECVQSD
jgi:hypothetical protein